MSVNRTEMSDLASRIEIPAKDGVRLALVGRLRSGLQWKKQRMHRRRFTQISEWLGFAGRLGNERKAAPPRNPCLEP